MPKGPVGSSRPLRVAQAVRKHYHIQTVPRIQISLLFGTAGALLPNIVWYVAYSIRAMSMGLR